ncbi:hypothetical protein MLD38_026294 [Melastoma candidum]|uniref:Uncharacterized protein n=1 Tax=Melastoma candidum TaxID=119954 RepID=A0ACB9NZ48_9MYRT|nr:hypothetical protein MLD38_026294 [Melastoma candidum]
MSKALTKGPGNIAGVSASGLLLSSSALLLSSLVLHAVALFPYLVKLVSFLGPLFFTSFLVLLALLTLSRGFGHVGMSEHGLSSLMGACSTLLNQFRTNAEEGKGGFDNYEASEVYRIIFEAPDTESSPYVSGNEESELPVDKFLIYGDDTVGNGSLPSEREKEELPRGGRGSRTFDENSSRVYGNVLVGGQLDRNLGRNLGSFGSMSRSKEWKRTLACKLFEERHNSEGEGMDSLWETYEDETSKKDGKPRKEKKAIKGWGQERVDSNISVGSNKVHDEDDNNEGYEDEVGMDDKFCCLQALRLSAGRKMGLGMGIRPNVVKMSKAFKGMSWLHHHQVVSHGHGRRQERLTKERTSFITL